MHADHAPRSRACVSACLSAAATPALAGTVREIVDAISGVLPPQPGQQALRPAPPSLVRAKSSRRRLRGDVCGLAPFASRLAQEIRRMAGAEKTRIRR